MKTNLKIFVVTLLLQFLMSILLRQNVHLPQGFDFLKFKNLGLISPSSQNISPFDTTMATISQKLAGAPDNFQVKSGSKSLLNTALAVSDYEAASSYLVIDFDSGQVIAEKQSNQKLPIASLTKIVTAMVVSDLANPDDLYLVSKMAQNIEPTSIGVVEGQKLTVSELLPAMLMTSANDAAEVISEGVNQKYAGEFFVAAMNKKAALIGAENTHFANPQGFDSPNQFSTARDLALISHFALTHYPKIAEIVKQSYQFLPESEFHKQFDLYNWNGLLGVYPGVEGVKIGNTDNAGKTMVVLSERAGKKILVVVLGAPGIIERDLWSSELLDLGFEQLAGLNPVNVTKQQLKDKYSTWKYWN